MTVIVAMVDPPRPGLVLPRLVKTSPLVADEVADLYAAMAKDLFLAGAHSGGDLLISYRPEDLVPTEHQGSADPEAEVRALAADALAPSDLDDARFEVQVGSSVSARVGNVISHLLDTEEHQSAAVVWPTAPVLGRKDLDGAAMKLRRSEAVLGPTRAGRVAFAGFREPVDFTDAFGMNPIETLTRRASAEEYDVDFLANHVTVRDGDDLLTLLATLRARGQADRWVPEHTAARLDTFDLGIQDVDGDPELVRG